MSPVYGGVRTGLQAGDIAGIQAIYGARTPDAYQSRGLGVSLASPIDVTASLAASSQVVVSSVSLASIGDVEYYSFVAPAGSGESLQVTAAAGNVSMLSPQVSLYDAAGTSAGPGEQPIGLERQRDGQSAGARARAALLDRRDRSDAQLF